MLKVIILKGLPASGKSTWAKQLVDGKPGAYKRINKDDLRAMLDNSYHSKGNEKFVLAVRDFLILEALKDGKHVIVDDTNLHAKHEARIRELVAGKNVDVQVREFDVDVEECIKRDLKRPNSVGAHVIREMHARYNMVCDERETPPAFQDESLPKAIIVDVDGTIAKMAGRGPFDWSKVLEDEPIQEVIDIVNAQRALYKVQPIFVTGRDGKAYEDTKKWLIKYVDSAPILYSRTEGDMRRDSIVKEEIFNEHIKGKYYIKFVLDDRQQVVDMWRAIGLRCLQCAKGDF